VRRRLGRDLSAAGSRRQSAGPSRSSYGIEDIFWMPLVGSCNRHHGLRLASLKPRRGKVAVARDVSGGADGHRART
jgi:hypothetical protein